MRTEKQQSKRQRNFLTFYNLIYNRNNILCEYILSLVLKSSKNHYHVHNWYFISEQIYNSVKFWISKTGKEFKRKLIINHFP